MKDFDVCGLGNAIVDIFMGVTEAEFASFDFERGTMRLVDAAEQHTILEKFRTQDPRLVSGGSVANSIIALSQLGGRGAFIGCVGDDRYGLHYQEEFTQLGIDIGNAVIVNQVTGTCVCLITPDAERTMRTHLGVSSHMGPTHIDEDRIKNAEWLFIEGYLLANPGTGQEAVRRAIAVAKQHGTKIALTCSDAFIVTVFGDVYFEVLKQSDLLFCNATEAMATTNTTSAQDAFTTLKTFVPNSVVTDGPHGAYVRYQGNEAHVPAFDAQPKDLTGAGDMFAGAFLYGITHGIAPAIAARGANYLAMKVISQIGARLHHGVRDGWTHAAK